MSKLNKDSVGEGVGVCFLQPMITFIMFLCHIAITCDSYIHNHVCTQAHGERARIHTTQMQTCVSVVYAAFCVLHFELPFLAKLVPQKSSGALGKGRVF